MKCTNKRRYAIIALLLSSCMGLAGCGDSKYTMAYQIDNDVSSYQLVSTTETEVAIPFASGLCVAPSDVSNNGFSLEDVGAAGLFDLKNSETVYAQSVNEQVSPASLTKIMTALVALKYGSPEQVITASENVTIKESGAQLCGLKPGDKMTLDQALHILMIYSANDVAVLIAEGVAGSVDAFVDMMNEEAASIGATNCHFMNPNGLTQDDHYVTTYDLYLIFQEAMKYDLFNQIIQMTSYSTTYTDSRGAEKALEVQTTNLFLRGTYETPANITVIGGKTGTTNAAGHCLILLSRSSDGTPYISVIMKDTSRDVLYADMGKLLELAK